MLSLINSSYRTFSFFCVGMYMNVLEFPVYKTLSSIKGNSFTSLFTCYMPLVSFSCLISPRLPRSHPRQNQRVHVASRSVSSHLLAGISTACPCHRALPEPGTSIVSHSSCLFTGSPSGPSLCDRHDLALGQPHKPRGEQGPRGPFSPFQNHRVEMGLSNYLPVARTEPQIPLSAGRAQHPALLTQGHKRKHVFPGDPGLAPLCVFKEASGAGIRPDNSEAG